jgi:hypothetical protein
MKSNIEYLAIPYLHDDEAVMQFRADVSDIIFADLSNQGRYIYAPISSCHHIAQKYDLPRDWKFWAGLDEEFVTICKTLLVITLPGWVESTGVTAEISIANREGIPIEYIDPRYYVDQLMKLMKEEKDENRS